MKMSEEPKNRSDLQAKYEKFQVKNYKQEPGKQLLQFRIFNKKVYCNKK